MNILTLCDHTSFIMRLAKTGHDFYLCHEDGTMPVWDETMCPQPSNVRLHCLDPEFGYDLAVVDKIERAQYVFKKVPDLRIVAIGQVAESTGAARYHVLSRVAVVESERAVAMSRHSNVVVIKPGFHSNVYSGYTGDIGRLISVCAPEFCGDRIGSVIDGLPHSYVGNEQLPAGLPHLRHSDLRGVYKHFRAMVYTPAADAGPGHTVIEAMVTGMPIVISDFADWGQYIVNGVNGFLSDDPAELRRFCKALLASPDYAKEVGQRGREMATGIFDIGFFVSAWNDLFASVSNGSFDRSGIIEGVGKR